MMNDSPIKRRRGNTKSRGGCTRCKSQHLKCDEGKPQCGRCVRLGVQCPGYVQRVKFVAMHETREPKAGVLTPPPNEQLLMESTIPPQTPLVELDWMKITPVLSPSTELSTSNEGLSGNVTPAPLSPSWQSMLQSTDLMWDPQSLSLDMDLQDTLDQQNKQMVTVQKPRQKQNMLRSLGAHTQDVAPRIQSSLIHQSTELISYYFKEVTRLYAVYDDHRNPFRSVVSNLYSHSLVVNLAAQSMAAACLVEVHPRFDSIGRKLRKEAMQLIWAEGCLDHKSLLALMMFGPTGNWHDAKDLGLDFYALMRDQVDTMAESGELVLHEKSLNSFNFFREAMVFWEMLLAFVADSDAAQPCKTPVGRVIEIQPAKRIVHPWTGVARDSIQLLAAVGRLVRGHRLRIQMQQFVTQVYIAQMNQDLAAARELESRLLACAHPEAASIVDPEDSATPVWHLTTLAELYRYAGLLQLYRVFPDILTDRLAAEEDINDMPAGHRAPSEGISAEKRAKWLTAFSIEALRLLETIPLESGTRDFQPFLLVILSGELVCDKAMNSQGLADPTSPAIESRMDSDFIEVAMVRKFVRDRLTTCLKLIPPKPIRVCLDIVTETWRRIDSGQQNIYWLDVMIQNGWETIMA